MTRATMTKLVSITEALLDAERKKLSEPVPRGRPAGN